MPGYTPTAEEVLKRVVIELQARIDPNALHSAESLMLKFLEGVRAEGASAADALKDVTALMEQAYGKRAPETQAWAAYVAEASAALRQEAAAAQEAAQATSHYVPIAQQASAVMHGQATIAQELAEAFHSALTQAFRELTENGRLSAQTLTTFRQTLADVRAEAARTQALERIDAAITSMRAHGAIGVRMLDELRASLRRLEADGLIAQEGTEAAAGGIRGLITSLLGVAQGTQTASGGLQGLLASLMGAEGAATSLGTVLTTAIGVGAGMLLARGIEFAVGALRNLQRTLRETWKEFKAYAVSVQLSSIQLEVLAGSAGKATALLNYAREQLGKWPFTFQEIVGGLKMMQIWGLNTLKWMPVAADVAAATGKQIERIVYALGWFRSGAVGYAMRMFRYIGINLRDIAGLKFEKGRLVTPLKEAMDLIYEYLSTKFAGLAERVGETYWGVTRRLKSFILELGRYAVSPALDQFTAFLNRLHALLWSNRDALQGFARAIGDTIGAIIGKLAHIGEVAAGWITHSEAIRSLINWLKRLGSVVAYHSYQLYNLFGPALQSTARAISDVIRVVYDWIAANTPLIQVIRSLWSALREGLQILLYVINEVLSALEALLQGDWEGMWAHLGDAALTVLSYIAKYFSEFGQKAYLWGRDLIYNFARGLWAAATTTLRGVVAHVTDIIAHFLEGHSPPRYGALRHIAEWGANLSRSFAKGIGEGEPWGINLVRQVASGMRRAAWEDIPKAANFVGTQIARFLKGHSPPEEGELSEIEDWGAEVIDAFIEGMQEGDLSSLDPVLSELKERLYTVLVDARIAGAAGIEAFIQGWTTADFSAFEQVLSDLKARFTAAFRLMQLEGNNLAVAVGAAMQSIQTDIAALTQGGTLSFTEVMGVPIADIIRAYQLTIAAIDAQELVNELQAQATEVRARIAAEREALQAQLQAEADAWRDRVDAARDAAEAARDHVDALKDQMEELEEQIQAETDARLAAMGIVIDPDLLEALQDAVKDARAETRRARENYDAIRAQTRKYGANIETWAEINARVGLVQAEEEERRARLRLETEEKKERLRKRVEREVRRQHADEIKALEASIEAAEEAAEAARKHYQDIQRQSQQAARERAARLREFDKAHRGELAAIEEQLAAARAHLAQLQTMAARERAAAQLRTNLMAALADYYDALRQQSEEAGAEEEEAIEEATEEVKKKWWENLTRPLINLGDDLKRWKNGLGPAMGRLWDWITSPFREVSLEGLKTLLPPEMVTAVETGIGKIREELAGLVEDWSVRWEKVKNTWRPVIQTIRKQWDDLVGGWKAIAAVLSTGWRKLWPQLTDFVEDAFGGVIDYIRTEGPKRLWASLAHAFKALTAIGTFIIRLLKGVGNIILDVLSGDVKGIYGDLKQLGSELMESFTEAAKEVLNVFLSWAGLTVDDIIGFFENIKAPIDTLRDTWNKLKDAATTITLTLVTVGIIEKVRDLIDGIRDKWATFLSLAKGITISLITVGITEKIRDLINSIRDKWETFLGIGHAISIILSASGITEKLRDLIHNIRDRWQTFLGIGHSIAIALSTEGITETLRDLIGTIRDHWRDFLDLAAEKAITLIPTGITETFKNIIGGIRDRWRDLLELDVEKQITIMWSGVTSYMKGLLSTITDKWRALMDMGHSLTLKLSKEGPWGTIKSVIEAIKNAWQWLWDHARLSLSLSQSSSGGGGYQRGGRVQQTGLALVHANEVILNPAQQARLLRIIDTAFARQWVLIEALRNAIPRLSFPVTTHALAAVEAAPYALGRPGSATIEIHIHEAHTPAATARAVRNEIEDWYAEVWR